MCPGACVIAKSGLTFITTDWGVTPQGQNMVTSPSLISTGSPTKFRMIDVLDPDHGRVSDVDWASVHLGKLRGDRNGLYDLLRRHRTHGDDHFA